MEQTLTSRGLKPKLMTLDNEASKLLKDYLHDQDINFQLIPPYCHQKNAAECAIGSFKDHLIAGLCSTDKAFAMHMWDRLLPQAILTLNMLRTSRIKIYAATRLDGQYEYNRAPMAPPCIRIIAHETPNRRQTWAPHGKDGWYIGPALEHYRCYRVYTNRTRSERLVETVELPPTEVKVTFPSSKDLAAEAAKKLTYALTNPQPAGPFAQVRDGQLIALKKLTAIFEGALPKHRQRTATPIITNESISPQRVDITESPHREQQTASAPRVVVPTTPAYNNQSNNTQFSRQITNHATQVCHSNHTTSYDKEKCRSTQPVPSHVGGNFTTRKSRILFAN
jgi:hypothetical protein